MSLVLAIALVLPLVLVIKAPVPVYLLQKSGLGRCVRFLVRIRCSQVTAEALTKRVASSQESSRDWDSSSRGAMSAPASAARRCPGSL